MCKKNMRKIFALLLCVILVLTGMDLSGLCIVGVKAEEADDSKLPDNFITSVTLGYFDSEEQFVEYTEDVEIKKDAKVFLWFDYDIPKDNSLKINTDYSFELETTNSATMVNAIKEEEKVTFDVLDGTVKVAECYAESTEDGNIKVTISFTADAENYFTGSTGVFWFHAFFNADNIANTGKQDINISISQKAICTQTVNFEVTPVKASLDVQKAVVPAGQDADPTYIKWKITATPGLEGYKEDENYLTEFVIVDTLQEPLNGLKINKEETEKANSDLVSGGAYSVTCDDEGSVTVKANPGTENKIEVKPVEFYVVTEYDVDDVIENYLSSNGVTWKNNADAAMKYPDNVKRDDGTVESTVSEMSKDITATHTLTGVELQKSNGVVQDDGTIMWTITAANGIGVPDPYLSDTLPEGLVLDETKGIQINNVSISQNNSGTYSSGSYSYDSGTNKLTINLQSGKDPQTITYYTTYEDTDSSIPANTTLTNTVTFYYSGNSEGIITQYGFVTPGSAYISKNGTYYPSTHTIDWTVSLSKLNMATGTLTVNDVFGGNVGQILQDGSIKIEIGTSGTELTVKNNNIYSDDGNNQVGTITINNAGEGFDINFFENAFADAGILNKIGTMVIKYTTKLNEEHINSWINKGTYVNNTITIKADGIPGLSTTGHLSPNTPVFDKNFVSYDYKTHTAEWMLTVNSSRMVLEDPVVTDVISDTDLNWEYKTDGLTVKQGEKVLSYEGTSKDSLESGKTCYVEYTEVEGKPAMKVYLPSISDDMAKNNDPDAQFVITYQTTIADDASLEKLATNDLIKVENNAALSGSPIQTAVSDGADFTINAGQISKDGTYKNENREITWTIDVNKNNAIIEGNGEKVAVCDVLQTGLLYLEDSLKVSKLTEDSGKWSAAVLDPDSGVYSAAYDDETRKLTITFEDDSDAENCITNAYRIEFNTRVLVSGEYTNSANFAADESTDSNNSSETKISGKFGGGYTSLKMSGAALLLIHGKDTFDDAVRGGEFTLYKEGVSTPIAILTTDETWSYTDGDEYNAFISGLPYGKYILKRTGTPDRYTDNALEAYPIELSADHNQVIINVLYLQDDETENMADIIFSKEILGAGKEIAGAALTLTYENGSNTLAVVGTGSAEGSPAVVKADDNKSVSWVSTKTPLTLKNLPEGEYSLKETNAPQGYAYAETICFKIEGGEVYMMTDDGSYETTALSTGSESSENRITMKDDVVRAYFSKKAAESGNELPGAEIKLTGTKDMDLSAVEKSEVSGGKDFTNDGTAVTWISTDIPVELTMLPDGEYTMTETAAPEGYQYADAVRFKIEKGLIYLYNAETAVYEDASVSTVTMQDESFGATFSKTIAGGGLELPGAVLTLTGTSDLSNVEKTTGPDFELSADKKTVTWTSTDVPLSLKGLPDGIYILHEEAAPDGYKYAEDITVKINGEDVYVLTEDGTYKKAEYGRVYMVDAVSGGIFSKVEAGAGKEIAGAAVKLIYEGNGNFTAVRQETVTDVTVNIDTDNKVISWISGENPVILAYLPNGDYIFREEGAPDGYKYAEEMKFRIISGNIYMEQNGQYVQAEGNLVIMEDEAVTCTFSKIAAGGGEELPGAELTLTYEGKGSLSGVVNNGGGNGWYIDGNRIGWTSTDKAVVLSYLPDGDYTFHEEGAPEGYAYASDMRFKIENGNIYLMNETGTFDTVSTDKIVMIDEAAAQTNDEEGNDDEEGSDEEEDTGGEVVDTGDHIYPVLLICAVLMLLSAAVMYAAYYRKDKDLME